MKSVVLGALFAAVALAQPAITKLQNNYSYILPGLPNYGIAQGSIFDIFGTNLSGTTTALLSVPLQTTVSGVSATVTVNGVVTRPIFYYLSPTQIAAILPSATPVGTGQITVTNNGQTSAPAPIQVVQSAFGILTLNGAGTGPAAAFDVRSNYLGFTNAANPGEYVTLWGSGVGPASGDETVQQTPRDLENVAIQVEVGGRATTYNYHGRSIYPGLDQINVLVPSGVQGCYVSVVIRSGNIVSNFATIPVAVSGRTCSDQTTGLTADQLQLLSGKGTFNLGSIGIGKTSVTTPSQTIGTVVIPGGTTVSDTASASFLRYTPSEFSASTFGQTTSIGSCVVSTFSGSGGVTNPIQLNPLNAGPAINVSGPNGQKSLTLQNGFYGAQVGGGSGATAQPIFIPASGGAFTFNGPGGPDVGAFTASINMAPPLVWQNQSSITTVNRPQGVTVNWTGGDPNSFVQITGASITTGTPPLVAIFTCTAPVAALQFTVPATVLLALPPSGTISAGGVTISAGSSLSVSNYTNPGSFTAPGIDLGFISAYVSNSTVVTYQ